MTINRYIQLTKMTFGELLEPHVSIEEFDFLLDNFGKNISEIKFE